MRQSVVTPPAAAWRFAPVDVLNVALLAALIWPAVVIADTLSAPLRPAVTPRVAAPADLAVLARFDPFSRASGPAAAGEALPFTLHGLRPAAGGQGTAIIGRDGRQAVYAEGEEVAPGIVLSTVTEDRVEFTSGGRILTLTFPETGSASTPAAPAPPAVTFAQADPPAPRGVPPADAPPPRVTPSALMSEAGLRPHMEGLRVIGYAVNGGGAVIERAGLRRGDIILSVNGVPLGAASVMSLRSNLETAGQARIEFRRAGRIMTSTVPLSAR